MKPEDQGSATESPIAAKRLVMAGLGVVIATAGFSIVLVQIYRNPPGPMRDYYLRLLIGGALFLFSGRALRVYGSAVLLALLLVLFAIVWLHVGVMIGLGNW